MAISFEFPELSPQKTPEISKRRPSGRNPGQLFAHGNPPGLPNADLAHRVFPEALDALNVAVFITDPARRLSLANSRAQQILDRRDGLQRSVMGTLEASRSGERTAFEALLNHASLMVHTVHARSKDATLAIKREPGRRPLTIVGQPLETSESQDRAVLIFALDPERSLGATEGELRELHGMTAREARLANLLMEGHTLEECCDLLEIQTSTGRMHLGNLFAKTGAQRQCQLVSILLSSLGAIDPCSAERSIALPKAVPPSYPHNMAILLRAGVETFDRLEMGLAVTDAESHLLFANRIANRVLRARDGLEVSHQGILRTLDRVNLLTESRSAWPRRGGGNADRGRPVNKVLCVARPSAKRPLTLMVREVESSTSDHTRPAFLVFILDPERPLRGAERSLRQLYELTPCEARLANLLMEGNALDACCEQLQIRESTARMHLSNLFAKTGVQRQGQLISLLVKSLGILRSPDMNALPGVNLSVESCSAAHPEALRSNE